MEFCLKMLKRPKFGIFFISIVLIGNLQGFYTSFAYPESISWKNKNISNFSKFSEIHHFSLFRDSNQPSKKYLQNHKYIKYEPKN